jgi:molecular chaperone GrpE (heat shock protein)
MNKLWIIWAVLLVGIGAAGLGYVGGQRYTDQLRLGPYQERFSGARDEYLAAYEEWSRLPAEVKEENPWGQGRYGGQTTTEQLAKEQPARLKADLIDLARGIKEPHPLADVLYGADWRGQVADYRQALAFRDNVTIGATICLAAGAIGLLGLTSRWLIRRFGGGSGGQTPSPKQVPAVQPGRPASVPASTEERDAPELFVDRAAREHGVLRSRHPSHGDSGHVGYFEAVRLKEPSPVEPVHTKKKAPAPQPSPARQTVAKAQAGHTGGGPSGPVTAATLAGQFQPSGQFTNVATLMSTDPVGVRDSLTELTHEMSAIRQFAAQQQDRVRQLQEGYDWNIIKRFCMRVIRCVDNLDGRIAKLAEQRQDVTVLEDVRDELVFALESSGVEQFEPELESEYKGKEKSVEAVRTRLRTSDSKLKGKIAEIIRPGYRYVVSDNDVRVVRCAQVKLYG